MNPDVVVPNTPKLEAVLAPAEYRGFLKGQIIDIITSEKAKDSRELDRAIKLLQELKRKQETSWRPSGLPINIAMYNEEGRS